MKADRTWAAVVTKEAAVIKATTKISNTKVVTMEITIAVRTITITVAVPTISKIKIHLDHNTLPSSRSRLEPTLRTSRRTTALRPSNNCKP